MTLAKLSKYKLRQVIDQAKKSVNYQTKKERNLKTSKHSSNPMKSSKSLIQKAFPDKRPAYNLIADSVLGTNTPHSASIELSDDTQEFSGKFSQGIRRLRKQYDSELPSENIGDKFGIEADGRPIWSALLDHERGLSSLDTNLSQLPDIDWQETEWPNLLENSSQMTFRTWTTIKENQLATSICEKIIDGIVQANPIIISGPECSGKSHLLHATCQALREQKKLVYLKQSVIANQQEKFPPAWEKWVPNLDVLAVENIEKCDDDALHKLGSVVDLALNHDVLVLLTHADDAEEIEAGRLKELVKQGLNANIRYPSQHSLLLHLRRKSMMESAGLTDELLSAVVKHSNQNWKTAISQFEKLLIAIDSGIDIQDAEDAEKVLLNTYFEEEEKEIDKQHIQIMAQKLVKNAIDEVYTDKDVFGVELHTKMPEIGTDSYEPPSLKPDLSQKGAKEIVSKAMEPHITSTLDVHESERHMIHQKTKLSGLDSTRVNETVTSIENMAESAFEDLSIEHENKTFHLARLETEIEKLSLRSKNASTEDLIKIADRIKEIEQEIRLVTGDDVVGGPTLDVEEQPITERRRVLARLKRVKVMLPEATA